MKFHIISSFLLIVFMTSCSVDYYPDDSFIKEKDRIIINSYLEPEHTISIYLYTTLKTDSGYIYQTAKNTNITLREEEKIIYQGICQDAVLKMDYYPKIGANYSVEVSLNGYETVSATTQIPDSITSIASVRNYDIFKLSKFRFPSGNISLWVTMYNQYEDGEKQQYSELYSNNLLVDKINRLEGADIANNIVGSGYHEGFLRIKPKNLTSLDSLLFTPMYNVSRIEENLKYRCIRVTSASKEYDQYNKTFYQQLAVPDGGDLTSITYQPIHVYTNINNGLGIFAGINESIHYFVVINENNEE